ncbi:uncharacterized protein LOC126747890 [Anthonomus grandis grandis]|uniref:uncharacterized protein LOC126747890 n=1 Tax=Anthonomus grandis grandis TaxID=2921223 RepID=UPI0021654C81|nr:uncharacterized protein LOC126747890 [Anthonomus grandis grandis]XP_050312816.1 uncharacterized protein LOC126747890 [Anthonomus grandis grandis]
MSNGKSSSESDTPAASTRSCRWKKSDPSQWKRNIAKKNKMSSLLYKSKKGIVKPAKKPRLINCESCKFKCSLNFSDELRNNLCSQFWALDYKRQKDFIVCYVTSKEPACRRVRSGTGAQKTSSRFYYFLKEGTKVRVCKTFFLRTLCISHGSVDKAFSGVNESGIFFTDDKRGRRTPANKKKPEIIEAIKAHIQSFPTMASHYCRATTKRKYLDSILSIVKMYALYAEESENAQKEYASRITYRRIFGTEFNLSFFKPKKDQCLICTNYQATKSADLKENYESHIQRRDEANATKNSDKERALNDDNFVSVIIVLLYL